MKITYDHYFGQQENNSIQLYHVNLQCEPHEECEALANGWLLYNDQWYQSRSTRICIADYKPDRRVFSNEVHFIDTPKLKLYQQLWYRYLDDKQYEPIYDPFVSSDRDIWMEYYWPKVDYLNGLRGFTKFIKYNGGLESQFNAYVIHVEWEFGREMLNCEVEYARSLGLEYLYIGSGYEKSSIYKAYLSGFEWWNGVEWSNDKNEYIALCKRDSSVATLADLNKIANK